MKKIESLAELKKERVRLKLQQQALEEYIQKDIQDLKTSLEPANLIMNQVKKAFVHKEDGVMTSTVDAGIDLILRKFLLRNSGLVAKLVIPFFVKNLTSNYVSNHKSDITSWIGNKIAGFFSGNGKASHYDRSTADINASTW